MGLAEDIKDALRAKAEAEMAAVERAARLVQEKALAEQARQAEKELERREALRKNEPVLDKLETLFAEIQARERLIEVRDTVWHTGELDPKPTIYFDYPAVELRLRHPYLRLDTIDDAFSGRFYWPSSYYRWNIIKQDSLDLFLHLSTTSQKEEYQLWVGLYSSTISPNLKRNFDPQEGNGAKFFNTMLVSLLLDKQNPAYYERQARREIEQHDAFPLRMKLFGYKAGDRFNKTLHYYPQEDSYP